MAAIISRFTEGFMETLKRVEKPRKVEVDMLRLIEKAYREGRISRETYEELKKKYSGA